MRRKVMPKMYRLGEFSEADLEQFMVLAKAAPDLLEALLLTRRWIEVIESGAGDDDELRRAIVPWRQAVDEAIAKATPPSLLQN